MKKSLLLLITLILVLLISIGCSQQASQETEVIQEEVQEEDPAPPVEDDVDYSGAYQASGQGYHGAIDLELVLDKEGKILSIEISEDHEETQDIAAVPIDKIPAQVIENQSLDVDSITGATLTSNGIIEGLKNALELAGLNPYDYGFSDDLIKKAEEYELDLDSLPEIEEKTDTITITDAKNRQVELNLPISRYGMSTMDVIDYIIPILGQDAFHKLVGSGQDGGGGLQGYARVYIPIVGQYMEHVGQISDHNAPFDLEMILAVNPEVIIVNSAMGAHKYILEVEDELKAAGIEIVLIDVPGKDITGSVQDTLRLLGQIFGKEERAEEVASFIDEQYQLLASKNLDDREDKPTYYYEKSGYSEIFGSTSTSASGWGALISAAGGDNIADKILLDSASGKGGSNTLDPEFIIEEDPDYIILSGSGAGWMDNFEGSTPAEPKFDIVNRIGWKDLSAVKEGEVYELAHASSRSIFGFYPALKMASVFYPEDFEDTDVDAIMDDFFEKFMLVPSNITGWVFKYQGAN